MSVGSFNGVRTWAIVFLAAGAVCSTSCAPKNAKDGKPDGTRAGSKEHIVLVRAEKQNNGKKKGIPVPKHLLVSGYDPAAPDSVVIWAYRFPKMSVTFKPSTPPIPDPKCDDAVGECTSLLPAGLTKNTKYSYTITGADADGPFDPNDPDIEVDR
jgi:hypothetical protein